MSQSLGHFESLFRTCTFNPHLLTHEVVKLLARVQREKRWATSLSDLTHISELRLGG